MARISHARSFRLAIALAAVVSSVAVSAAAALGQASNASVSMLATGPGGLKIEGKTSELLVKEEAGKVHFVVPLAHLDTGIELRNRHMRDKYLEVGKYPNAELVLDRAALKFPEDGRESSGSANGTMTIHGQTKPVTVSYKAKRSGNSYDVSGSARVNIKDYGVDVPSYLGVTVKPDVDVSLSARVQD